jgi:hypothetical protein
LGDDAEAIGDFPGGMACRECKYLVWIYVQADRKEAGCRFAAGNIDAKESGLPTVSTDGEAYA